MFALIKSYELSLIEIERKLRGDASLSKRNENQPPSIIDRLERTAQYQWATTSAPTQTHKDNYKIIGEEFLPILEKLRNLGEKDIPEFEKKLELMKAPWTPGRLPEWKIK